MVKEIKCSCGNDYLERTSVEIVKVREDVDGSMCDELFDAESYIYKCTKYGKIIEELSE